MALTQVSTGGIKDGQVHTADLADGQITAGKLHADALDRTYTLGADGSNHYTFTGEGLTGAVNDPTLYLTRGKTYRFVNGNSAGAHPFRIQTTVNGSAGTEYNTGVTNNGGAGGSTIVFEVPHDAPDVLYYQCTSHGSMGGVLYITGALADGGVTEAKIASGAVTNGKLATDAVTTAKIANSAITNQKLGDDCVTGSRIADDAINSEHYVDGSIDTAHIADDAVTFAKMQNTSTGSRLLGKHDSGAGEITEITPDQAKTMLGISSAPLEIDYIVIAGGGGGGGGFRGGGGGGGGYRAGSVPYYGNSGSGDGPERAFQAVSGTAYSLIIGAGGTGNSGAQGSNGGNSTFGTITSTGGGGGGHYQAAGSNGGSGGGGGGGQDQNLSGGTGIAGQGTNGGTGYNSNLSAGVACGGGGGGASYRGFDGGSGGDGGDAGYGQYSTIRGYADAGYLAGGGAAGAYSSGNNAPAAIAGGTNGVYGYYDGNDGLDNTGHGGSGSGGASGGTGGTGGSGVIYLRHPSSITATFSSGVTVTTTTIGAASDKLHKVTAVSDNSQTVTFT